MDASFSPAAGTVIDERYELVEPLEDRGLGESWTARDVKFKSRRVAVKFLRVLETRAATLPDDLVRHFKTLRALRHPNVLATVNHGVWQSQPYIVQDLFPGASLGSGLDQARKTGQLLPVELLSGLFDRVCLGVGAGHKIAPQALLHLGLNPGCVLIHRVPGQDFDVRVFDQGLVAWADPSRTAPSRSARALRSPAPEQFAPGATVGPAADVFALGTLLREMLAIPALLGETLSPAGMSRRREDVPEGVWDVIDHATQPGPEQRFLSINALRAAALGAWFRPVAIRPNAPSATAPATPIKDGSARVAAARRADPPDLFKTARRSDAPRADSRGLFGPMPRLPEASPDDAVDLSATISLVGIPRGNNPWDLWGDGESSHSDAARDALYRDLIDVNSESSVGDLEATRPSLPMDFAAGVTIDQSKLAELRNAPVDDLAATLHFNNSADRPPPAAIFAAIAARPVTSTRGATPAPPTQASPQGPGVSPVHPEPRWGVGRTVLAIVGVFVGMGLLTGLVIAVYVATHP